MPRRSRRRAPTHSGRKNAKKRSQTNASWPINIVIGLLVVVILGFGYSSIRRLQTNETAVNLSSKQQIKTSEAASPREIYEQKPYTDIWVEVLNGNGVSGVAGNYTEYLRAQGFDVQRTDNADHFSYERTRILDRSDSHRKAIAVARALEIDTNRVEIAIDQSLQLDVTVILGKDYKSLPVYEEVRSQNIP